MAASFQTARRTRAPVAAIAAASRRSSVEPSGISAWVAMVTSTEWGIGAPARSEGPAEEDDIAVEIPHLEAAQPVVAIADRLVEADVARRELARQHVGVGDVDEGVPGGPRLPGAVRLRRRRALQEDLDGVAADDGEERIALRLAVADLEVERLAVELHRARDVGDDEEGRDRFEEGSAHRGLRSRPSATRRGSRGRRSGRWC